MTPNARLVRIAASVLVSAFMLGTLRPAVADNVQSLVISPQGAQKNAPKGPTGYEILYSYPENQEVGSFELSIFNPNPFAVIGEIFLNPLTVESGVGLDGTDIVTRQYIGDHINPLFYNDLSGYGAIPANTTETIAINLRLPDETDVPYDYGLTRLDILALDAQDTGQGNAGPYTATGERLFDVEVYDIPEPTTLAILGIGSIGLLARRKRAA